MASQRGARIRVTTLATTSHTPWAECDGCDWERHPEGAGSWAATREAARRHAAHHGHVVHAGYQVMHAYGVTVMGPR